jgi:hypothetical protein
LLRAALIDRHLYDGESANSVQFATAAVVGPRGIRAGPGPFAGMDPASEEHLLNG